MKYIDLIDKLPWRELRNRIVTEVQGCKNAILGFYKNKKVITMLMDNGGSIRLSS